jgi:RND family efflux transporter MFP subunit
MEQNVKTKVPHGDNHHPIHELDPGDSSDNHRIATTYAPRTGRMLAFGVAGLALLLVVGFAIAFAVRQHHEQSAVEQASAVAGAKETVEVVDARPTPGTYPLTLPGQTAGWYESTIFARVDGYVAKWTADIGDRVKQNQVLATIDTPEMDQQLNAARAKAAASDAQVQVAESNVSISKLTYDRWRESPKGVVSEQEREEKKATYDSAKAHLAEATAQAQLDQADVGRYTAMEAFKNVIAPYDGVITARHVDIGELVTSGSSANTSSLYSIAQSNVIRVFVDVPQKAAASLAVGLPAYASSDQFPGKTFQGKVARTAMSIDPQTRTQRTEVDIPNDDLTLVPGMYVQVTFELNQRGLMEVPAAAILFRPDGLQVAVVDDANKIDFRNITVAKDNGDTVEVASGVKQGDRVAVNINSDIALGQEVTVVEDEADKASPPQPAIRSALIDKPLQPTVPPIKGPIPSEGEPGSTNVPNPASNTASKLGQVTSVQVK